MAQKEKPSVFALEIPIDVKKFPPDATLSCIGFDKVSVSKGAVKLRKNHATDLLGRPMIFTEICISKSNAVLSYSVAAGGDSSLRRLASTLLLLRVLSIFPQAQISAAAISAAAVPSLETASALAETGAEPLSFRLSKAQEECAMLLAKNRQLSRKAEEAEAQCLELERQAAALSARVQRLEGVSDPALRELVLDWVLSHSGPFSIAHFSRENRVPIQRTEETIDSMLMSGQLRQQGAALLAGKPANPRAFEKGPQLQILGIGKAALGAANSFLGKK